MSDTVTPEDLAAIKANVRALPDDELAKEIYFAESLTDPNYGNAVAWRDALNDEAARRLAMSPDEPFLPMPGERYKDATVVAARMANDPEEIRVILVTTGYEEYVLHEIGTPESSVPTPSAAGFSDFLTAADAYREACRI